MDTPNNAAAEQIVRAQSIIADLTAQWSEIQSAIGRQQTLIEALTPLAVWSPAPVDVEEQPQD